MNKPSDIFGAGHGDAHLWRYEGSNDGGNSFYICERCRKGFCHSYRRIANIFNAMKAEGVSLDCKAPQSSEVSAHDKARRFRITYIYTSKSGRQSEQTLSRSTRRLAEAYVAWLLEPKQAKWASNPRLVTHGGLIVTSEERDDA